MVIWQQPSHPLHWWARTPRFRGEGDLHVWWWLRMHGVRRKRPCFLHLMVLPPLQKNVLKGHWAWGWWDSGLRGPNGGISRVPASSKLRNCVLMAELGIRVFKSPGLPFLCPCHPQSPTAGGGGSSLGLQVKKGKTVAAPGYLLGH